MQRPGKRRRQDIPDSAGLDWANPSGAASNEPALRIQGLPSTFFENGGFNPEDHLIPWQGDASVLVDRYDGRLLLETLTSRSDRSAQPLYATEGALEAELDAERYSELDPAKEDELASIAGWYNPNVEPAAETNAAPHEYATGANMQPLSAVQLSYGTSAGDDSTAVPPPPGTNAPAVSDAERTPEKPFEPSFDVPDGLAVPETARLHKIIAQTAKFVRSAGRQSVFVLRVKQANNPNFTFLMPHDPLHPYFEWLLETNSEESVGTQESAEHAENKTHGDLTDAGNALGLLSSYGSESVGTPTADGQRENPFSQITASDAPLSQGSQPLPDSMATEAARAQPSSEVQAIIGKLVKFVQKSGAKFEASVRVRERDNPRFGFLQPNHRHHWFYREELTQALGKAGAEAILTSLDEKAVPTRLFFKAQKSSLPSASPIASERQEGATEQAQAANKAFTSASKAGFLRANPSMVMVASRPLTEERALGQAATVREPDADPALDGRSKTASEPSRHREYKRHQGGNHASGEEEYLAVGILGSGSFGVIDSDEEFLKATAGPVRKLPTNTATELAQTAEGDAQQAAASNSEGESALAAEEERKAQRRRLARELLKAKHAQQSAKPPPPSPKVLNNIVNHRSAFFAEDEEDNVLTLPGEGSEPSKSAAMTSQPAPIQKPTNVPAPRCLPKLEDLLKAKRSQPTSSFSDFEVISPESDANGTGSKSRMHARLGEAKLSRSSRRRDKSSSSEADSSGSEHAKRSRRHRSRSSGRRSHDRKQSKKGTKRQKKPRRRSLSSSGSDEKPTVASQSVEERIRAMLRTQL